MPAHRKLILPGKCACAWLCVEEQTHALKERILPRIDAFSNHAHVAPFGAQAALTPRDLSLSQTQGRRAAQECEAQQAQPQPGALAQQEQGASAQQAPLDLAGADQPGGSNITL